MNEIAVRTGHMAMVYTNTVWWNACTGGSTAFSAYPLFIANYHAATPPLPPGWSRFTFWQYTGSGSMAGITGAVDQDVFNGDISTLARLAGARPSPPRISLLAHANSRFVTAENAGRAPLAANRATIGNWEQFDVVDASSGYVALRARANGRYVTAEDAGDAPLVANRTSIGNWEKFRIVDNADGSISIQAFNNSRYVTAEEPGRQPLIANRTAIGTWEQFRIIDNGDGTISLRARANNRLVTAEAAGTQPLIANRTSIHTWEKFQRITD